MVIILRMEREYDLSKFFRNPERTKRLRENGCIIQVTRSEGENEKIVREYFISPEEIQADDIRRKSRSVQNS